MRVTCSEFRANFGRYLDFTLTEPVIITNFARDQGVLISAGIFHTLRTRSSATAQKALGESITITISEFQKQYAHYQKVALNNPVVMTTHSRERTVLLSPEDFDALFEGCLPKHLDRSSMVEKVTTTEFQQKVGHHLSAALKSPFIITKHGRERNALLSAAALWLDLRAKSAKAEFNPAEAITVTASELELQAGYYQDLAVTRPVIVTVKENEQNVLISAEAFRRLMRAGGIELIDYVRDRRLPPMELRDKYTYEDALNAE